MVVEPLKAIHRIYIEEWCRNYQRHNKYPADLLSRYAISIYQIHQGMEWTDGANKAESYMSAFLHLEMVAGILNVNREYFVKYLFLDHYETWPMRYSAERILYLISKVQQQLFYFTRMKKTQRGSRYKPELTARLITELQEKLICLVPSHLREQGIYDATKIMTGVL